jgi:hypothetical protein
MFLNRNNQAIVGQLHSLWQRSINFLMESHLVTYMRKISLGDIKLGS